MKRRRTVMTQERPVTAADAVVVSRVPPRNLLVLFTTAAAYYCFCVTLFFAHSVDAKAATPPKDDTGVTVTDSNVYLDVSSVVLITGAAGFLGSELAMALHRTYAPKKIIGVDSMDQGFGSLSEKKSGPDLSLFEFKRQRVFHMLQTVEAASMYFYRVDLRPSIPEYFDTSEVPVLHHIFEEHPDITHIVHLADHVHHAQHTSPFQPVIPRKKGQEKAGLMEGMLEELVLQKQTEGKEIQFVYASSAAVYNHFAEYHSASSPNRPPFAEDKPLTTPSTTAGASKLVDELLAQAYHEVHAIASTAVRLFNVYGPWGLPGSAIFDMAERTVAGQDPATAVAQELLDNVADYIYIDDAIDAIMAAMQFRTTQPQAIAINVGSGMGTSLRTIAGIMRELFPKAKLTDSIPISSPKTVSYSNNTRASKLLGFAPHVSLRQGIQSLLAWHYDRAYPYGSGGGSHNSPDANGIDTCSRFDTECLRGTPVFPCASECSHPELCQRSLYDDVLPLTRAITAQCTTVLYTVSLGRNITRIPSTYVRVSTQSIAFVDNDSAVGSHCNLAFVSADSPLYQKSAGEKNQAADGIVRHGFWSLIPVVLTKYADDKKQLLSLLPKLSPGRFFADTVQKAIYSDPDVIFDSIPRLLQESNMQPKHPTVQGATVMLIGKMPVDVTAQQRPLQATVSPIPPNELVQGTAYRMIRIAVIDEMAGDGFAQKIDSGFIVHTLRRNSKTDEEEDNDDDDDGRLFRCDVMGEVLQWKVDTDLAAWEFILGLHDMWSRVMVKKSGLVPWWIGDEVATVTGLASGRRLEEVSPEGRMSEKDAMKKATEPVQDLKLMEETSPEEDDEISRNEISQDGQNAAESGEPEHNEFGVVGGKDAVLGDGKLQQQRFGRPENEEADDFVVDDDDSSELNPASGSDGADTAEDLPQYYFPNIDLDPSSYDVWMGVLSSTPVRYFSRIVSMEAVGVYRVKEEPDEVSAV